MSQRINISVSDDLYQKIQAFKDGLNISKLCQDALRQAVSIEEFRSQVGEDIERLAIAFKKEREEYGRKFWEEGFRDGTKDAFKMDYQLLYDIEQRSVTYCEPPREVFELGASKDTREKVESNLEGITKHGSFHDSPYYDFDDFGDFYFDGWVAGCIDVWERVCTKLSIHGFKKVKETPHGNA